MGRCILIDAILLFPNINLIDANLLSRATGGDAHTSVVAGRLHATVPWWWYLIAVLVGLTLLGAVAYGLHKVRGGALTIEDNLNFRQAKKLVPQSTA